VQGEDVAVIGGGNSAIQIVRNLLNIARTIHLVCDSQLVADPAEIETIKNANNVKLHEHFKVLEFHGSDNLEAVRVRKKAEDERLSIRVRGAFVAVGLRPNSALVSNMVDLNEKGEIIIGPDCSTSHPGIFAAGDVTNAFGKRIVVASGEGAKAAMAAKQHILNMRKAKTAHAVASL